MEKGNNNTIALDKDGKPLDKKAFAFEDDVIHFQKLDSAIELSAVLIKSNATEIQDIINRCNNGEEASAVSSILGTLIEPGKIGIINHNGKVQIVGPGRYIFPNPRATLEEIIPLTQNPIKYETLTIVRVQPGQYGLALESGTPRLLDEGLHVYNTRLFVFVEFKTVNQNYLNHGNIHIIRVPRGSYGLVRENNVPKLLAEGLHVTVSNIFAFDSIKTANTAHIQHGTINILQVPKGTVALVTENNQPKLLYEGTHYINSANFAYAGVKDLNSEVITHGTITRFRVRKGQVGLAWLNSQPTFFEEGVYEKDDPNFSYVKSVDAGDKQITLGSKKIVTVYDGEVGVSFFHGKLKVLHPDRHIIESAEHIFQGFLSTQQQCLHLFNDNKFGDRDLLICETKDFVEIGIKADVFYRIADAEKVLLVVGKDSVVTLVRETAVATLNSIIRSTSLAEVAQNKDVRAKSEKKMLEDLATQNQTSPNAPSPI